ncbi:hypothetical protein ACTHGU_13360 [Chitinophagaceae bacterium MMS25-I14]
MKFRKHPFFIRLMHWEYWSSRIVYLPLYPYWLWLSIKARSFFFLTAANPNIRNGGFIMESKKDIYDQLPEELYPATCRFDPGTDLQQVLQAIAHKNICFPLIAKPDLGERGLAVKKIYTPAELEAYIHHMPVAFLVQEFIAYGQEAGIFYYRMPGTTQGHISGIVSKHPVAVTGDGVHTVQALASKIDRYILQQKQIEQLSKTLLNYIPQHGEEIILIPYGNHSRGSLFLDESSRISPQFTKTINNICNKLPAFYYGRLDIRFHDWQQLEQGKEFSVIEINGSGSEPTHIYDPKHSIFFAWKEIIRHWRILYRISKENHRKGSARFITLRQGQQEVKSFRAIDAALSARAW